jgi:hypothetical protein
VNPDDLERRLNEMQEQLDWLTNRVYWMWQVFVVAAVWLGCLLIVTVGQWWAQR